MSITSEIESVEPEKESEVFKLISKKLSAKNDEALECLVLLENLKQQQAIISERYKRLTEEEMPELFSEIGISSLTLSSGEVIGVTTSIHCGIPAHAKEQAFKWLEENKHGDLIKNELKIKFGRNEGNMVADIKSKAEELGLRLEEKRDVHSMTLKAFVKEQMRQGTELPNDLFGVYVRRVVEVSLK